MAAEGTSCNLLLTLATLVWDTCCFPGREPALKPEIFLRGRCGHDLPMRYDASGLIVNSDLCLNKAAVPGSHSQTIRDLCKTCPHAGEQLALPMPMPQPKESTPMSEETKPASTLPTPTSLPTDVPPPFVAAVRGGDGLVTTQPIQVSKTQIDTTGLAGVEDEASVDIDAALATIPEMAGGPSAGGMSWSSLGIVASCWRQAWFSLVQGLVPTGNSSKALTIGTLVHACFEMHYKTGGQKTFVPCDVAAAAGAPIWSGEARNLVYGALSKYAASEAATWDIRGVENQGTWFMPPERINGKKVYIPLTCRHDLLVALRKDNAPCTPPGQPVEAGVWVLDFKTAASLSYDLTKGYSMDPQFLMNALIYNQAEAAQFGPLAGVIISIIVKHKNLDPEKSFFRIHAGVEPTLVWEFYEDEVRPQAIELYRKLSDPKIKTDRKQWKKNHKSCVGRYGLCRYFDICDTPAMGEDAVMADMYRVDPSRQMNIENFLEAPKEVRSKGGRTPAEVATADATRAQKKAIRDAIKEAAVSTLIDTIRTMKTADGKLSFDPNFWVVKSPKQADVVNMLSEYMQEVWKPDTEFTLTPSQMEDKASYLITPKGMTWKLMVAKGTISWSAIAKKVAGEWYDPAVDKTPSSGE